MRPSWAWCKNGLAQPRKCRCWRGSGILGTKGPVQTVQDCFATKSAMCDRGVNAGRIKISNKKGEFGESFLGGGNLAPTISPLYVRIEKQDSLRSPIGAVRWLPPLTPVRLFAYSLALWTLHFSLRLALRYCFLLTIGQPHAYGFQYARVSHLSICAYGAKHCDTQLRPLASWRIE